MNNVYTIAIGAASSTGAPAYYDEPCSAKMAVSFVDNPSVPNLQVVCLVSIKFDVLVSLRACMCVCLCVSESVCVFIHAFGLFSQSTTTTYGNCTDKFSGTSSATPLVSGVIALVLEAK